MVHVVGEYLTEFIVYLSNTNSQINKNFNI